MMRFSRLERRLKSRIALLLGGRAVLSAALFGGEVLEALALARILTLAGVAPGLAIRLAFAGVDPVAGSRLGALIRGVSGSHHGAIRECKQSGGSGESQVGLLDKHRKHSPELGVGTISVHVIVRCVSEIGYGSAKSFFLWLLCTRLAATERRCPNCPCATGCSRGSVIRQRIAASGAASSKTIRPSRSPTTKTSPHPSTSAPRYGCYPDQGRPATAVLSACLRGTIAKPRTDRAVPPAHGRSARHRCHCLPAAIRFAAARWAAPDASSHGPRSNRPERQFREPCDRRGHGSPSPRSGRWTRS